MDLKSVWDILLVSPSHATDASDTRMNLFSPPSPLPVQAALIMQVLSLSDEQILMLPPDQRNSILKLKEQIARSN